MDKVNLFLEKHVKALQERREFVNNVPRLKLVDSSNVHLTIHKFEKVMLIVKSYYNKDTNEYVTSLTIDNMEDNDDESIVFIANSVEQMLIDNVTTNSYINASVFITEIHGYKNESNKEDCKCINIEDYIKR